MSKPKRIPTLSIREAKQRDAEQFSAAVLSSDEDLLRGSPAWIARSFATGQCVSLRVKDGLGYGFSNAKRHVAIAEGFGDDTGSLGQIQPGRCAALDLLGIFMPSGIFIAFLSASALWCFYVYFKADTQSFNSIFKFGVSLIVSISYFSLFS